jgi:predicted DNA-binding mobile mystery protein A
MKSARLTAKARSHLDERFKAIGPTPQFAQPVRGWIRAIRESLGMTTAQLAQRLGVKQPTVVAIEQSEEKATIQLDTLRRVAAALDCQLVYALVPNQPLEQTLRKQARQYLNRQLAPIEHSMLLENQQVPRAEIESKVDELLRDTNPRKLWD